MGNIHPLPTKRSPALAQANQLALYYRQFFNLPMPLARSLAMQQQPRKNVAEQGNQWRICRITYFAKKYQKDITRLCHIQDPDLKAPFPSAARHLKVFDLERGEERTPIIENIKRIDLLKMQSIVELTRQYEYVECLVYGYTASQSDLMRKARLEAMEYDYQE
jgi:hypothetical protein